MFPLSRTAIYYATYFTQETLKIARPEHGPPYFVKLFDCETYKQAMDVWAHNPDKNKIPHPDIHLFIGQRGTAAQFSRTLICVKAWSCKAKHYHNKIMVSPVQKSFKVDKRGQLPIPVRSMWPSAFTRLCP